MLTFHLLENCGTPVLSSHSFTVLPGDRSPGGVGIWGAVGLATVNKHTGREEGKVYFVGSFTGRNEMESTLEFSFW